MNLYNQNSHPDSLIVSKWSSPVEAFTPHPKYTNPILCCKKDNIKNYIYELKNEINDSEIIIAHETTKENAENIIKEGFKIEGCEGSCNMRDMAVFGWIHESDIGEHPISQDKEYVVLLSVPRNKLFISSYNTSAKQIILGDITKEEYEYKHVLSYNKYKNIFKNKYSFVSHLNYDKSTLLLD